MGVGDGVGLGLTEGEALLLGVVVDGDADGDVLALTDGLVLVDDEPLAADVDVVIALALASTTLLGTSEQEVVELLVVAAIVATPVAMLASAPSARGNVPKARKANAANAPSAAGLMISGLMRATSFRSAS